MSLNHFIATSHLVESVFLVVFCAIAARRRQIFSPRMTYFCPNSVSTNAGTSAITAVALIRFHCRPISLTNCAMTTVMTGVFWPVRMSANKNSFQGKQPAQYRQCRDRRDGRWQRDPQKSSPSGAAIDQRRIFHRGIDAVEEAFHEPWKRSRYGPQYAATAGRDRCRRCPSSASQSTAAVPRRYTARIGRRRSCQTRFLAIGPRKARQHVAARHCDHQREHGLRASRSSRC